jgi:hypothetical protein
MSRDLERAWLEVLAGYAGAIPRRDVVSTLVDATRRAVETSTFDPQTVRDATEKILVLLRDRGYSEAELAPLRDYVDRFWIN